MSCKCMVASGKLKSLWVLLPRDCIFFERIFLMLAKGCVFTLASTPGSTPGITQDTFTECAS